MRNRVSSSPPARVEWFDAFARKTATLCGKPIVFLSAVISVIVWACTGPLFGFSDTWQLVINTGTTVVTFAHGLLNSKYSEPRYFGGAD
jgi:low affinity Fe/Cu permease